MPRPYASRRNGTAHSMRLLMAEYEKKKVRKGGHVCQLASTFTTPRSTAPRLEARATGWAPAGWSRTTRKQATAPPNVSMAMRMKARRQPAAATRAASGTVPPSAPSTPTVAVTAESVPKCERGNQSAAILRQPMKVTVAPDAEAVDQDASGDHEARVRPEVHGGEEAHDRAGRAEVLHDLLDDDTGSDSMQEAEEEEERGNAPHEPAAGRRSAVHALTGPEACGVAGTDNVKLLGRGRRGFAAIVGHPQIPARGRPRRLHALSGMIRGE